MQDRTALYNRACGLVKEYETNVLCTDLSDAMYDCLKWYIKLYNQEVEQIRKLDYVIDLCKSK